MKVNQIVVIRAEGHTFACLGLAEARPFGGAA